MLNAHCTYTFKPNESKRNVRKQNNCDLLFECTHTHTRSSSSSRSSSGSGSDGDGGTAVNQHISMQLHATRWISPSIFTTIHWVEIRVRMPFRTTILFLCFRYYRRLFVVGVSHRAISWLNHGMLYLLQRKLNSIGRRKMDIHVLVQCAQPASMSRLSRGWRNLVSVRSPVWKVQQNIFED